jgi:uncharacterized membrane protein
VGPLIVTGYKGIHKAGELRPQSWKLQRYYLPVLEDVLVVVKNGKGIVKLYPAFNLTSAGAMSTGFSDSFHCCGATF